MCVSADGHSTVVQRNPWPFCYLAVLNESSQRPYLHVAIELTKCQWEFVTFGGSSLSGEINDYFIT